MDDASVFDHVASFPTSLDPPETNSQPPTDVPGGSPSESSPDTYVSPALWASLDAAHKRAALVQADKPITQPYALSTEFRHTGWAHNRLLVFRALTRTEQPDSRLRYFATCGQDAYVLQSIENPSVYRLAGSSCHDRFCLPCASDRARGISMNVLEHIADRKVRFLTLTLKASSDPLTTQLDKLYDSFQALRRRAFWSKHVRGGIAFLELTYNDNAAKWHPHFHILIEGTYIDHLRLRKLWYDITTDSFVIDIRSCNSQQHVVKYVTKYASKPFNNTFLNRPDPLDEAILALKGRKLALTFGSWRGLLVIPKPSPEQWDNLGPLEAIIEHAAHGDQDAFAIIRTLTDIDLDPILARAPPIPPYRPPPDPPVEQLTFFGLWNDSGSYA